MFIADFDFHGERAVFIHALSRLGAADIIARSCRCADNLLCYATPRPRIACHTGNIDIERRSSSDIQILLIGRQVFAEKKAKPMVARRHFIKFDLQFDRLRNIIPFPVEYYIDRVCADGFFRFLEACPITVLRELQVLLRSDLPTENTVLYAERPFFRSKSRPRNNRAQKQQTRHTQNRQQKRKSFYRPFLPYVAHLSFPP